MAKNKKSIVLVLGVFLVGILSYYGYRLYINPVERSAYICRAGDDTVYPEESLLGCSSIVDWKHCTNGSYLKKSCTEI
jgi:hypothetical protein